MRVTCELLDTHTWRQEVNVESFISAELRRSGLSFCESEGIDIGKLKAIAIGHLGKIAEQTQVPGIAISKAKQ